MTHVSSMQMLLRRDARRAATPIDGPFAETKEWALSAAEPGFPHGHERRRSDEGPRSFSTELSIRGQLDRQASN